MINIVTVRGRSAFGALPVPTCYVVEIAPVTYDADGVSGPCDPSDATGVAVYIRAADGLAVWIADYWAAECDDAGGYSTSIAAAYAAADEHAVRLHNALCDGNGDWALVDRCGRPADIGAAVCAIAA